MYHAVKTYPVLNQATRHEDVLLHAFVTSALELINGVVRLVETCHHRMARPHVTDGGDGLEICMAAKINSRRQSTRGGPPAWGVGGG